MPYYGFQAMKRRGASTFTILAMVSMLLLGYSCGTGAGKRYAAVLDPGFASLFPEAEAAFSKKGFIVTVLEAGSAAGALHSFVDANAPERLVVSPLLARELPAIQNARPGMAVAHISYEEQGAQAQATALRFDGLSAARVAGQALAGKFLDGRGSGEALVAAVFAGQDAQAKAQEFSRAFMAAGNSKLPIVEVTNSEWSQEAADRLRALDLSALYLSIPPREAGRWINALSDQTAVIVESAHKPATPWPGCAGVVRWDLAASLDELLAALDASPAPAAFIQGKWRFDALGEKGLF